MRWIMRAGAIGGAALLALGASATPAMAADIKLYAPDWGGMEFIDDGDMFRICDLDADGSGVTGYVMYDPSIGSAYAKTFSNGKTYINDGGDAGCDKAGINIGNDGNYQMWLCLDSTGRCVVSAEFNE